jgi:hypothetical protein
MQAELVKMKSLYWQKPKAESGSDVGQHSGKIAACISTTPPPLTFRCTGNSRPTRQHFLMSCLFLSDKAQCACTGLASLCFLGFTLVAAPYQQWIENLEIVEAKLHDSGLHDVLGRSRRRIISQRLWDQSTFKSSAPSLLLPLSPISEFLIFYRAPKRN